MQVIHVPAGSDYRGMTYLPGGQQMSMYLPAGAYQVVGEVNHTYSDLGQIKWARACQLVSKKEHGGTWYIGLQAAEMLGVRK